MEPHQSRPSPQDAGDHHAGAVLAGDQTDPSLRRPARPRCTDRTAPRSRVGPLLLARINDAFPRLPVQRVLSVPKRRASSWTATQPAGAALRLFLRTVEQTLRASARAGSTATVKRHSTRERPLLSAVNVGKGERGR